MFLYFYGGFSIFKLVAKSFWKSALGPFFAFGFPLICISILGFILGYEQVVGGTLALLASAVTLISLPQVIFEFKNSSILKRVGATPVKTSTFLIVITFFYILIILLSIVWCILFILVVFGSKYWNEGRELVPENKKIINGQSVVLSPRIRVIPFKEVLQKVNWWQFFISQVYAIILGISFGLVIVTFAKSAAFVQAVGVIVFILNQFLSAQVFPIALFASNNQLWWIGNIIIPFKGPSILIIESWNGQSDYLPGTNGIPTKDAFSLFYLNPETKKWLQTGYSDVEFRQIMQKYNNSIETYVQPNIVKSDIFDIKADYYYLPARSSTLESVPLVFTGKQKIIFLVAPVVWILLLLLLTKWKFRWSLRG